MEMEPAAPPKPWFFFDVDDVNAVEGVAARALLVAMKEAQTELQNAAERDPHFRDQLLYLASWLDTESLLDEDFAAATRGNARRLCNSVRRFVDGALSLIRSDSESLLVSRLQALYGDVKWAAHAPLTSSQLELRAVRMGLAHGRVEKVDTITAVALADVAVLLRETASGIAQNGGHLLPLKIHVCADAADAADLSRSARALAGESARARDHFAALGRGLGVGAHGMPIEGNEQRWRKSEDGHPPHVFSLVALVLEAAEHLECPRAELDTAAAAALHPRDTVADLRRTCTGIRVFLDAVESAILSERGALALTRVKVVDLRCHVAWAMHVPSNDYFRKGNKWEGDYLRPASIDRVAKQFADIVEDLAAQLELVRFVQEAAGPDATEAESDFVSARSWRAWGWPLWVALELGDCPKQDNGYTQGSFAVHAHAVGHRVPFLLAAADGIASEIDGAVHGTAAAVGGGAGTADRDLFLLRADRKVCRELVYAAEQGNEAACSELERWKKRVLDLSERDDARIVSNGSQLLPELKRLALQQRFSEATKSRAQQRWKDCTAEKE